MLQFFLGAQQCIVLEMSVFVYVIPELPESMCLNFDCGAQIKLGFAAEFSNVLVIYTHIVKKPEDMSFCQAHVTDFSQVSTLSWTLVIRKKLIIS